MDRWGEVTAPLFSRAQTRPGWHPWQVLGRPGTGKTTLLRDLAAHRLSDGADPESVLVLTASKRAARRLRDDITERFLASGGDGSDGNGWGATREPLVRTVHSYAFAILRLQASVHGNPPPRLLTGAEHDSVIREMLAGEFEDDGGARWPEHLRPALQSYAFADSLRDLLARARERGVMPEDLVKLGKRAKRAEWVAAAKFALRYEETMLLRWSVGMAMPEASAPALDAAELVGAALTALQTDDELLRRERARVRTLLVDDAQHLDPQSCDLIRVVGTGTDLTVIAGDSDQAVFGFRGADARFLTSLPSDQRITLSTSHRASSGVAEVLDSIASRFPGRARAPIEVSTIDVNAEDAGSATVQVLPTSAQEASFIADVLRREHLQNGVAWSDMAVIVRSVPRSGVTLRRALGAADIPVRTFAADLPLARQRAVTAILSALRAVGAPETVTPDDAIALVSGPIGGADAIALRRLRRGLRRIDGQQHDSGELVRLVVLGLAPELFARLTDVEAEPIRRVRKVLDAGTRALDNGLESTLWAVWQATGLSARWARTSLRGGATADQAHRDLDAMVTLFDEAAAYSDRLRRPTVAGFLGFIAAQEIPASPKERLVESDAVTLISAHAAGGQEWEVVAVAGVEEGVWPNLGVRGSLLGTPDLLDLIDGTAGQGERLSRMAPVLAEERRLFYVACSRARRRVVITAAESADQESMRSRFLHELVGEDAELSAFVHRTERSLQVPSLVGQLRRVVCDPSESDVRRQQAARHLARLAQAGAAGAHPDDWYGLAEPSTTATLVDGSAPIGLSPSSVEQLLNCPLRWVLQRNGGDKSAANAATTGTIIHTLAQALANRTPLEDARKVLENAWSELDMGAAWFSRREFARTSAMLDNFTDWYQASRANLTLVEAEVKVAAELGTDSDEHPTVRISGQIDRLEKDVLGRLVVVDLKTGKNPVTAEDAKNHPQLATYQLALQIGGETPGGAHLVYVNKSDRKTGATQRNQPALDDAAIEEWKGHVRAAATATVGPKYLAVMSDKCRHCPVQNACPAQDCGRQVGQ